MYQTRHIGASNASRDEQQDPDEDQGWQGTSIWSFVERGKSGGGGSSNLYRQLGPNELHRHLQMDVSYMTTKEKREMNVLQW